MVEKIQLILTIVGDESRGGYTTVVYKVKYGCDAFRLIRIVDEYTPLEWENE